MIEIRSARKVKGWGSESLPFGGQGHQVARMGYEKFFSLSKKNFSTNPNNLASLRQKETPFKIFTIFALTNGINYTCNF